MLHLPDQTCMLKQVTIFAVVYKNVFGITFQVAKLNFGVRFQVAKPVFQN